MVRKLGSQENFTMQISGCKYHKENSTRKISKKNSLRERQRQLAIAERLLLFKQPTQSERIGQAA